MRPAGAAPSARRWPFKRTISRIAGLGGLWATASAGNASRAAMTRRRRVISVVLRPEIEALFGELADARIGVRGADADEARIVPVAAEREEERHRSSPGVRRRLEGEARERVGGRVAAPADDRYPGGLPLRGRSLVDAR